MASVVLIFCLPHRSQCRPALRNNPERQTLGRMVYNLTCWISISPSFIPDRGRRMDAVHPYGTTRDVKRWGVWRTPFPPGFHFSSISYRQHKTLIPLCSQRRPRRVNLTKPKILFAHQTQATKILAQLIVRGIFGFGEISSYNRGT